MSNLSKPDLCLPARAQSRTTGKDEDEAIRHLFQRLAVLMVKAFLPIDVGNVYGSSPLPAQPSPDISLLLVVTG